MFAAPGMSMCLIRSPEPWRAPHKLRKSWDVVCQLIELEVHPDKFKQRGTSPGHEVFQVFSDVMVLEMGTGRTVRVCGFERQLSRSERDSGDSDSSSTMRDLRLANTARQETNVSGKMHPE